MDGMGRGERQAEERFAHYVRRLGEAIGHADRREPLRAYLTGLLLSGERKSIEPMAARIEPQRVGARHQSMHHFVAKAPWDDDAVLSTARDYALGQLERHAPVAAWIVDDTGIPKKGKHSVGVARQYCGVLGKQDNCQIAVTVSLANSTMSVPCAWRLYLPEPWVQNRKRRKAAGIPNEVEFRKKWQIALEEIDRLLADDLPRAPVVADAGYGSTTEFREGVLARGLSYAVGVMKETSVWPEGTAPLGPTPRKGGGRPPTLLRRSPDHQPVAVIELAHRLPDSAWTLRRWREGTKGTLQSRFALCRVRAAHRDYWRPAPRPEEWLVIEWPRGETEPTKYFLSSVPKTAPADDLIRLLKLRWRIERDYEEMKDELGLDHYEGRGWRGFHHHGVLCMAAYCFLAAERARLSPPQPLAFLRAPHVPKGFRPRGAALAS
jgi:SRSO17 transposase